MFSALCRLFASAALLLVALPLWAAEPVRIGVLAFPPKPWQLLTTELKRQIPERDFEIEVLDHAALEQAVASRRLDFVLTNPGQFLLMQRRSGLSSPLATLVNNDQGHRLTVFAGAIICRAERADIKDMKDIRGKTVAYADLSSQGGFQAQAYELANRGIDPQHDVHLLKLGLPHDKIVEAVLNGKADVGFVRAGLLEDMASRGKFDAARLRVLNLQDMADFPWKVSTHLYPEWPFAALPHTDEYLARRVTATLLQLDRDPALVRAMKIEGFTVPSDYQAVEEMLIELRLPPFDGDIKFTMADVWEKYRWQIIGALVLLGLVLMLGMRLVIVNRRLHTERVRVLTQSRQLAAAEELWRFALEGSGDGVWDWDVPHGKTMFSKRWKEMIGYGENEFADSFEAWAESLHPEDKQRVLTAVQDYFDGKTLEYVVEFRMRCKDAGWKWILARGMVVSRDTDGKPLRMIGTHTDITERKKAEEALQHSNADLERFAYSVSHDMRQPLRAVSGHLQLLQRSLKDKLDEDDCNNLGFALDGAKRMDSMIISLLDYSRVGRKTEAMQWMASRVALDEALGFLAPLIGDANAQVNLSGEWPQVFASRDELTRLFQNLIGNAIKFRDTQQAAQVEITSAVHGDTWRVSVRDHGVGIDPNQIDRLFQFFSRLQSRTRFEGTGMGLALCRRIVEHHNGRIWAESEGEDKGSTFCFEIPSGAKPVMS